MDLRSIPVYTWTSYWKHIVVFNASDRKLRTIKILEKISTSRQIPSNVVYRFQMSNIKKTHSNVNTDNAALEFVCEAANSLGWRKNVNEHKCISHTNIWKNKNAFIYFPQICIWKKRKKQTKCVCWCSNKHLMIHNWKHIGYHIFALKSPIKLGSENGFINNPTVNIDHKLNNEHRKLITKTWVFINNNKKPIINQWTTKHAEWKKNHLICAHFYTQKCSGFYYTIYHR